MNCVVDVDVVVDEGSGSKLLNPINPLFVRSRAQGWDRSAAMGCPPLAAGSASMKLFQLPCLRPCKDRAASTWSLTCRIPGVHAQGPGSAFSCRSAPCKMPHSLGSRVQPVDLDHLAVALLPLRRILSAWLSDGFKGVARVLWPGSSPSQSHFQWSSIETLPCKLECIECPHCSAVGVAQGPLAAVCPHGGSYAGTACEPGRVAACGDAMGTERGPEPSLRVLHPGSTALVLESAKAAVPWAASSPLPSPSHFPGTPQPPAPNRKPEICRARHSEPGQCAHVVAIC